METQKSDEKLSRLSCTPCRGGVEPLTPDAIAPYRDQLDAGWEVVDNRKIVKTFTFDDFAAALAFTNRVGELAEQQNHHPDIHLSWGRVVVELWTHKIGGLHPNDFILAAHIDRL